jgi:hypothetical protein
LHPGQTSTNGFEAAIDKIQIFQREPFDLPNHFEKRGRTVGGFGSGRHQRFARRTTDGFLALDISVLADRRALELGSMTTVNWSRGGHPIGSIRLQGLPEGLKLTYRAKSEDGKWETVRETIAYQWSATPFKGRRRWFACPGCSSRCRILYGGPRFRCRRCQGLSYESQYEDVTRRANRASRKIRRRLAGSTNLTEEFPPRPKGMHQSTYRKLEELDDDMQSRWARAVMKRLAKHL